MSSITSIQQNQLFSTAANQAASAKVTVIADNQKISSAQDENLTTSQDGDTLEISASGTALAQKTYTGQSSDHGALLEDEGYTDATANALSSAASSVGITEYSATKSEMNAQADAVSGSTSSSSSSSSSTSNLSSYSESQLREMLQDGEITRAEYEAELESRKTSTDDSEVAPDSTALSGATSADTTEA